MGASLAANIGRIEFAPDGAGHLASLDGDRSRTRGWFVLGLDVEPGYVAALATARPFRGLQHFIWSGVTPAAAPDPSGITGSRSLLNDIGGPQGL
jgi:hypothetical protein